MRLSEQRTKIINEFPEPKTVKSLKRFLGMASWCRNFVKDFAEVASPLHDLEKKGTLWCWGPKEQTAFDEIKKRLVSAESMGIYNPEKPLVVRTDASKFGLGAVLLQEDENGVLRPIEFASRKTNLAERNYHAQELECLAVVWACQRWSDYLQGQRFELILRYILAQN